jgi:type II secretory pathway pseudopilin PulG
MKKLAIGCVVLLVLGIAAIAAVPYVLSRISSTVTSAAEGFVAELSPLPQLERSVQKQGPYTPPPTGEPSREQVERLVAVQQEIRTRLGSRAADLERRYHRLITRKNHDLSDYREYAATYLDAKRAQVDALNRAGISLDEYRWTRAQVYAALGVPLVDLDLSRIVANAKGAGGGQSAAPAYPTSGSTASPAVKDLVEPHRGLLEKNVALASYGL